jgi:membrane peptidoglycan carboxypeptidase
MYRYDPRSYSSTMARVEKTNAQTKSDARSNPRRIMRESAALKLQAAMRPAVERGTAKSVANVLADTRWQIGGKTGTGPGPNAPGPESDGWFAGLIFDPQGNTRFTIATFVKHGGYGGGNAAWISAEVARFLIGANTDRP